MEDGDQSDGEGSGDSLSAASATADLTGVNFDKSDDIAAVHLDGNKYESLLDWEQRTILSNFATNDTFSKSTRVFDLAKLLETGCYAQALRNSPIAIELFGVASEAVDKDATAQETLRRAVSKLTSIKSVEPSIELELIGIAALNLFLQSNYTGPSLEDQEETRTLVQEINPHACFRETLRVVSNDKDGDEKKESAIPITLAVSSFQQSLFPAIGACDSVDTCCEPIVVITSGEFVEWTRNCGPRTTLTSSHSFIDSVERSGRDLQNMLGFVL
jgi:hypothetical protein